MAGKQWRQKLRASPERINADPIIGGWQQILARDDNLVSHYSGGETEMESAHACELTVLFSFCSLPLQSEQVRTMLKSQQPKANQLRPKFTAPACEAAS